MARAHTPKPKPAEGEKPRKPKSPPFKPVAVPTELSVRMEPPASGVKIRMYRQGHGDCFLLAFRDQDGGPFYMLIDCGMKKGSQLTHSIAQVAENIRDATGGHLHLVVITHEHEDHVSGFFTEREVFSKLTIDKLWLGWTEDPTSALANALRKQHHDVLLGLLMAEERLANLTDPASWRVRRVVDELLGFELSDDIREMKPSERKKKLEERLGRALEGFTNKDGIEVVKDRADRRDGTAYLRPHDPPHTLPNVPGVRCFVLGPPEDELKLGDENPRDDEQFQLAAARLQFAAAEQRSFLAAVAGNSPATEEFQPFPLRYRIPATEAENPKKGSDGQPAETFFRDRYFETNSPDEEPQDWRRIDGDWLRASETFALRLNKGINNTSVVLAIELPNTNRVLLFVGDAQRGNWVSWHDKACPDGDGGSVTAADLLGRTVFYKVGHHGSHNATMNAGGLRDMAQGKFADQFVAMVPANEDWALTNNRPKWRHPLKEIYKALLKKARGRVLVMDRPVTRTPTRYDEGVGLSEDGGLLPPADRLPKAVWDDFLGRTVRNDLFYECTVED